MIGAQDWERIKSIVADSLELPPREQADFARHACRDEGEEVQKEVQRLLSVPTISRDIGALLSSPRWSDFLPTAPLPPHPEEDLSKVKIPERYRAIRMAGRGGMGVVYEALDTERNLRVALKTFPVFSSARSQAFKQEFQSLAALFHPNLVCLYDFLREDSQYFLSMEFVDGVHFPRTAVDRERTPQLKNWIWQIAQGLRAIHNTGRLHGDLKPSNVLITAEDRVVIIDFGLARELGPQREGALFAGGTLAYLAPEVLAEGRISEAADWFALGKMIRATLPEDEKSGRELRDLALILTEEETNRRGGYLDVCKFLDQPHLLSTGQNRERIITGRTKEMDLLFEAYSKSRDRDEVTVALVEGESGYGKSCLIERFLAELQNQHPEVQAIQSRCYRQETGVYKALDDIVTHLSHMIAEKADRGLRRGQSSQTEGEARSAVAVLFPSFGSPGDIDFSLAGIPPAELRRKAFSGVRSVFSQACASHTLVIWIDDLQWIDEESTGLLSAILDPAGESGSDQMKCLLIASMWPWKQGDPIAGQRLLDHPAFGGRAWKICLEPLEPEAAQELAEQLLDWRGMGTDDLKEAAKEIARESEGVPFLVEQMCAAPHRVEAVSVAQLVWDRLEKLSPQACDLMRFAAVAGRPITQSVAYKAARLDTLNPAWLTQLSSAQILRVNGPAPQNTIEPMHEKIREAVAKRLDAPTSEVLHRELAVALETFGDTDPEFLAGHFEAGEAPEKAGGYYAAAGRRANELLAFAKAARLLKKALGLGSHSTAEEVGLRYAIAEALTNDGRSREASEYYRSASEQVAGQSAKDLRMLSAYHLCAGGALDEGGRIFRELLGRSGKRVFFNPRLAFVSIILRTAMLHFVSPPSLAQILKRTLRPDVAAELDLLWYAAAGIGSSDLLTGFELLLFHAIRALRFGDPERLVRALVFHGAFASMAGQTRSKLLSRNLEYCQRLAEKMGSPPRMRAWLTLASAIRSYNLGFWSEALERYRHSEDLILQECRGLNWELSFTRAGKLWSLLSCGDVSELYQESSSIIENAVSRGDLASAVNAGSLPLPYAEIVHLGKPEQARDTVRSWLSQWTVEGYGLQHACGVLAEVWSLLYEGQYGRASGLCDKEWQKVERSGILGLPSSAVLFWETRARIRLAMAKEQSGVGRDKLLSSARKIATRLRRIDAAHASAYASQIEAGLLFAGGASKERVCGELERSLQGFRSCGMNLHVICVLVQKAAMGQEGDGAAGEAASLAQETGVADVSALVQMHGIKIRVGV